MTASFASLTRLAVGVSLLATTTSLSAQTAPIVQPGAPGTATKTLTADDAVKLADTRYSPADVRFMQAMIPHHAQAVELSNLVPERTNRKELTDIAAKILASQADEITFMQGWLTTRGEKAPEAGKTTAMGSMDHSKMNHSKMDHSKMDHSMAGMHEGMAGMASPEDMAKLATLKGVEFDKMFLTLMIEHHKGAIEMVDDLLDAPGSAYDPVLFRFVTDVDNDQTAEIEAMNALLSSLADDPRSSLAAGFLDAGEASLHLTKLASLPKPAGFFDPANPAGLKPEKPKKEDKKKEGDAKQEDAAKAMAGEAATGEEMSELAKATMAANAANSPVPPERDKDEDDKTQYSERSPLLNFANTDIAFAGDVMVAGNYHGFNIYKLSEDDAAPTLYSSIVCPGGQGDISIVGDLLVMSVEQTRGRVDCGLQGVDGDVSAERFRGVRIFDISNLAAPQQVGQVQTCRGSHTHSVVSANDETIVLYNSGTARVRDEDELAGCIGNIPGDTRTALFSIDVIEIPVANPAAARIVDSPRVFADDKTGNIAGLWTGGDHGEGTQDTRQTNQCHDITVFPTLNLAAGACSGNGILLDITDPRAPKRIDAVVDKGFAYWHSATFNNDGTKVLFTDEWGGGSRPRCRAQDPQDWGANAFYDIVDGKLQARGLYKLPAPQGEKENCVAHNGSIIPVPGRDIFVQAWYQGGISVIDFTDSANPKEIAYFDRGPIDKEQGVLGGYWSVYWYNGRIYGTEIARGVDVFKLEPSEFLTAEEIAAAEGANMGEVFNPQTQVPVTWPAELVKAAEDSRKGG